MKTALRIALSSIIILSLLTALKAQEDSLASRQCDSLLTAYKNGTLYRLFQMDKEETYMVKAAFELFVSTYKPYVFFQPQFFIGLEKKIRPDLSIDNEFFFQPVSSMEFFGVTTSLNYYYTLNKRIFEGRSANNFSADYFKCGIQHICIRDFDYKIDLEEPVISDWRYEPSILIGYGIQRRFSPLGFLDVSVCSRFNMTTAQFELSTLSLKYGFGLSKRKRYGK